MVTGRQLSAVEYAGIKTAQRCLRKAIGTQGQAAAATRVEQQAISGYESTDERFAESFAPADIIADLEAECGQPIVTRKLAELAGHMLVPMPRVSLSGTRLGRITASALKETAEVFAELGAALDDERICKAESDKLAATIDEAMTVLAALKLQIAAEAEGQP